MRLLNNAESQGTGTTVTTANAGGGGNQPFDEVVIGANMTETFDSAHPAHGVTGFKTALTSTATAITYVGWTTTSWGTAVTRMFGAFYFYLNSTLIPSTIRMVDFMGGATLNGRIGCNNGLAGFQWRNSADAVLGSASGAITAGTLYRVEFDAGFGASAAGRLDVYLGDGTVSQGNSVYSATAFGTNCDHVRFGINTAAFSTTSGDAFTLDDLNINDVAVPGPGPYGSAPRYPSTFNPIPFIQQGRSS